MKRRAFFGLLGGAAVAGPTMAKQAVAAAGIESMALSSLAVDYGPEDGYVGGPVKSTMGTEYDHAAWLGDQIKAITGISEQERRERIATTHVSILDPDLAVNRSLSLSFKIHEQKRRNFDRYQERGIRGLTQELAEHLKSKLL